MFIIYTFYIYYLIYLLCAALVIVKWLTRNLKRKLKTTRELKKFEYYTEI